MRTAASVAVLLVSLGLGVARLGAEAPARAEVTVVDAPAPTTMTTTSTTEAPGEFIDGAVVEFGARPAPAPTTTTTAVPGRTWTWDQLADCETGVWGPGKVPVPGSARWAATRGVYQGGLQFDARTWDAYRGPAEPADAHLATREQQIAVAERVLAAQGAKAWPTCGPRIGMTGAGSGAAPLPAAGPPEHEPD